MLRCDQRQPHQWQRRRGHMDTVEAPRPKYSFRCPARREDILRGRRHIGDHPGERGARVLNYVWTSIYPASEPSAFSSRRRVFCRSMGADENNIAEAIQPEYPECAGTSHDRNIVFIVFHCSRNVSAAEERVDTGCRDGSRHEEHSRFG